MAVKKGEHKEAVEDVYLDAVQANNNKRRQVRMRKQGSNRGKANEPPACMLRLA